MKPLPHEFDHWHPALLARQIGRKPRAVRLCNRQLVIFRTARGVLGAFEDRCPHRRMQLSCGQVEGEHLVCPYHGYRFSPDGAGQSPSTPAMRLRANALEVSERAGVVWVRRLGATTRFPALGRDGFFASKPRVDTVRAPLELVVDNFSEVEHTPSTHALFGYRADSLDAIDVAVSRDPSGVRVTNRGPQKPLPWPVERTFGVYGGDTFVDDWQVRFSPVHVLYHQYWEDPASGARRPDEIHLVIFFVPVDRLTTRLFTFPHISRPPRGLSRLVRPLLGRVVAHEIALDRRMIEQLADRETSLKGTRLSRFDRPLRELRRRIQRDYRGVTGPMTSDAG